MAEKKITAGFHGASWDPARLPDDMKTAVVQMQTADGAQVNGFLHSRGGEKAAVMIMHPRELLVSHYLVPYLLHAGYAAWVQSPRAAGNDLRLEHEAAILDVAAGVVALRGRGYGKVILLGNSGGAPLFAFYNQQALTAPPQRISRTPAGRPIALADADMPAVDGFVFVAPHPGQGMLLLNTIDPSVVDEADPFAIDEQLNPFSRDNGFAGSGQSARYGEEFIARYRAGQRARVERIDAYARDSLNRKVAAKKRIKAGENSRELQQAAGYQAVFDVWRTNADLRCFDLNLDPSERKWGTVWGNNVYASNLGSMGFGRVCTPESWLSTWSGLSSNASFEKCGSAIEQPVLLMNYSADNTVFPGDIDAIFDSIGSADKQRFTLRGNHHGHPLEPGEEAGQIHAGAKMCEWLRETFS